MNSTKKPPKRVAFLQGLVSPPYYIGRNFSLIILILIPQPITRNLRSTGMKVTHILRFSSEEMTDGVTTEAEVARVALETSIASLRGFGAS